MPAFRFRLWFRDRFRFFLGCFGTSLNFWHRRRFIPWTSPNFRPFHSIFRHGCSSLPVIRRPAGWSAFRAAVLILIFPGERRLAAAFFHPRRFFCPVGCPSAYDHRLFGRRLRTMIRSGGIIRQRNIVDIAVGIHLVGGFRCRGDQDRYTPWRRRREKIFKKLAVVFIIIRKRRLGLRTTDNGYRTIVTNPFLWEHAYNGAAKCICSGCSGEKSPALRLQDGKIQPRFMT